MCGEMTFKSRRQNFTPLIKKCYELYVGCKAGNQDKIWVCHICCVTCVQLFTEWVNDSRQMPFAIPMFWWEPKDHSSNCYYYLTNKTGIISKSKHRVKHPVLPPAMRPVSQSEELPLPKSPENLTFSGDNSNSDEDHTQQEGENVECKSTLQASCSSNTTRL